jgi:energy-coupling factor transport system permease protein
MTAVEFPTAGRSPLSDAPVSDAPASDVSVTGASAANLRPGPAGHRSAKDRGGGAAPTPRRGRWRARRAVHPVAWWLWALGLVSVAMRSTNPVVLGLVIAVAGWVVAARRTDAPWGRSFALSLRLGAVLVVFRVVLAMLFGLRLPGTVLFSLPAVELPAWAAGVSVGGPVTAEMLLGAATEGLRLAAIVACFGAANSLANPYRLLRTLPAVLYELGVALTVALAFVPQTVATVGRIREARRLRGRAVRGVRGLRGLAMPVLEGALERSVDLAASMDARGYGRRQDVSSAARRTAAAALAVGLLGLCVGSYGLLDAGAPGMLGLPVLAFGSALLALGLVVSGRRVERTRYRPDVWRGAEWLVVALGAVAAVAGGVTAVIDPSALDQPLWPLAWPAVPVGVAVAVLASMLAGWVTPLPPSTREAAS